jgi:hypothetical protein
MRSFLRKYFLFFTNSSLFGQRLIFNLTTKIVISRKSLIFNNMFSPFSYKNVPKLFDYDKKKWCMNATTCLNPSLIITKPYLKPKLCHFLQNMLLRELPIAPVSKLQFQASKPLIIPNNIQNDIGRRYFEYIEKI